VPQSRAATSVDEPSLRAWLRSHEDSHGAEVARARLEYQELEGTCRFLRGLQGLSSVRPRVLVTAQVSGRWSTSDPPLVGLPRDIRGILVPAYGTFWTGMDMDAVEARLAATYAQEHRDLDVLARGEDLHAATAQDIFGVPIAYEDPRRRQAKTVRYNLLYAWDHRGILEAKDLTLFGGRAGALEFARRFLAARPALTTTKQRVFAECARTHQARSAFGRLRRLTGDDKTQGKDGWSQTIQATVSGMMNRLIPQWLALDPDARIVLNQHDGCILSWPIVWPRDEIVAQCQEIADRPWDLWGYKVIVPTTWAVVESPYG